MKLSKWEPTEDEHEVMTLAWTQVQGAYNKLKEETNAQNENLRTMLQEITDRYYS